MKRTTIFLTEDMENLLREATKRTHRPQAEIIREAIAQYLHAQPRPWPRSIGMGHASDESVTSENVKEWVRERWRRESDDVADAEPDSHAGC